MPSSYKINQYDLWVKQDLSKLPNATTQLPKGNSGDPTVNALLGGTWWHDPGSVPAVDTSASAIIHKSLTTPDGASTGLSSLTASSSRHTLTYSFLTAPLSSSDATGFAQFSSAQKAATLKAFNYISSLINVTFTQVAAGSGDINFGTNSQSGSAGYANLPYEAGGLASSLMLANNDPTTADLSTGTYGWEVLIHEIGHTLGLKHPGNYDAGSGTAEGPYLTAGVDDNRRYSVMSYNDMSDAYTVAVQGQSYSQNLLNPTTFMLYDIEALQYLYGANTSAAPSNNIFTFTASYQGFQTLWSPKGGTIDASAETYSNIIDLNAGDYSSIGIQGPSASILALGAQNQSIIDWWTYGGMNNVAIAYGSTINIAKGGSADDIFYLDMSNSDTIYGGAGGDTAYLYVKSGHTLSQDYTQTTGTDAGGAYVQYKSTASLGVSLTEKLYSIETVKTYSAAIQIHQESELTPTPSASAKTSIAQSVSNFIQSTASFANTGSSTLKMEYMPSHEAMLSAVAKPV